MKSDGTDKGRAKQAAAKFLAACPQLLRILEDLEAMGSKFPDNIAAAYLYWTADFARVTAEMRTSAAEFMRDIGWETFPDPIDELGTVDVLLDGLRQMRLVSRLPKGNRLLIRGQIVRIGAKVFVAHEPAEPLNLSAQENLRQALLWTARHLLNDFSSVRDQVLAFEAEQHGRADAHGHK